MLKHTRQGQDLDGVDAMEQGALAVECPACPQPSCNLPLEWDKPGLKS